MIFKFIFLSIVLLCCGSCRSQHVTEQPQSSGSGGHGGIFSTYEIFYQALYFAHDTMELLNTESFRSFVKNDEELADFYEKYRDEMLKNLKIVIEQRSFDLVDKELSEKDPRGNYVPVAAQAHWDRDPSTKKVIELSGPYIDRIGGLREERAFITAVHEAAHLAGKTYTLNPQVHATIARLSSVVWKIYCDHNKAIVAKHTNSYEFKKQPLELEGALTPYNTLKLSAERCDEIKAEQAKMYWPHHVFERVLHEAVTQAAKLHLSPLLPHRDVLIQSIEHHFSESTEKLNDPASAKHLQFVVEEIQGDLDSLLWFRREELIHYQTLMRAPYMSIGSEAEGWRTWRTTLMNEDSTIKDVRDQYWYRKSATGDIEIFLAAAIIEKSPDYPEFGVVRDIQPLSLEPLLVIDKQHIIWDRWEQLITGKNPAENHLAAWKGTSAIGSATFGLGFEYFVKCP
jgi:hypothetical protein